MMNPSSQHEEGSHHDNKLFIASLLLFSLLFYYFIQFVKKNKNPTFVIWQGYQCPMVIEERYQVAKARAKELSNDNGIF